MTGSARPRPRSVSMSPMFWHGFEGVIAWLLAGTLLSALFSITAGPGAWWVLATVSPFILAYGGLTLSSLRP